MRNHQSLEDAMNQLKNIKVPKKISESSSINRYSQSQSMKYIFEKQANRTNTNDKISARIPTDKNKTINSSNNKDLTPKISRPFRHSKSSRHSTILKDNANLKPPNIRPPDQTNNSSQNPNPRFAKSLQNIEQKSIKNTNKHDSIQPQNDCQNNSKSCNYRVNISNFKQINTREELINIHYKFGIRLLKEQNAQKRAAYYFKKSADKGHVKAMFLYATMLYDGYRIGMSRKVGLQYYKKAAFRNDIKAMRKYRPMRFNNDGIKKDRKEAARYFQMAADLGDIDSMRKYRSMLYDGDGIERDRKKAAFYFKIDADQGIISAICQYGTMLYLGDGIKKNIEEAAHYFKLAADKGDPCGMRKLAYLFQTGNGVELNQKEAARYYKLAADLGDLFAIKQYSHMLQEGIGIQKNLKEAEKYLKLAIDKDQA